MSNSLPLWVDGMFIIVAIVAIIHFYFSNGKNKNVTIAIVAWSSIHLLLAYVGFYQKLETIPPRFLLIIGPLIVIFLYFLTSERLDKAVKNRKLELSTYIHTIRIPVEIGLFQLYLAGLVPELMTFEGRNFDILAGISAPIIAFMFSKHWISKRVLLYWNYIGLCLVLFILFNGLLSAELPLQLFAFDQPNKAVTLFPFVLLPCTIVPIVLYTHIVDIIKLKRELTQ